MANPTQDFLANLLQGYFNGPRGVITRRNMKDELALQEYMRERERQEQMDFADYTRQRDSESQLANKIAIEEAMRSRGLGPYAPEPEEAPFPFTGEVIPSYTSKTGYDIQNGLPMPVDMQVPTDIGWVQTGPDKWEKIDIKPPGEAEIPKGAMDIFNYDQERAMKGLPPIGPPELYAKHGMPVPPPVARLEPTYREIAPGAFLWTDESGGYHLNTQDNPVGQPDPYRPTFDGGPAPDIFNPGTGTPSRRVAGDAPESEFGSNFDVAGQIVADTVMGTAIGAVPNGPDTSDLDMQLDSIKRRADAEQREWEENTDPKWREKNYTRITTNQQKYDKEWSEINSKKQKIISDWQSKQTEKSKKEKSTLEASFASWKGRAGRVEEGKKGYHQRDYVSHLDFWETELLPRLNRGEITKAEAKAYLEKAKAYYTEGKEKGVDEAVEKARKDAGLKSPDQRGRKYDPPVKRTMLQTMWDALTPFDGK